MIRIFLEKEMKKEFVKQLKESEEIWDFPLEEIDYLLEENKNKDYVLIDDRLYEID